MQDPHWPTTQIFPTLQIIHPSIFSISEWARVLYVLFGRQYMLFIVSSRLRDTEVILYLQHLHLLRSFHFYWELICISLRFFLKSELQPALALKFLVIVSEHLQVVMNCLQTGSIKLANNLKKAWNFPLLSSSYQSDSWFSQLLNM